MQGFALHRVETSTHAAPLSGLNPAIHHPFVPRPLYSDGSLGRSKLATLEDTRTIHDDRGEKLNWPDSAIHDTLALPMLTPRSFVLVLVMIGLR